MKHWLIAVLALILFGATITDGNAQGATKGGAQPQGLTRDSIMGKWCTEVGSYNFTSNRMIVTFASDGSTKQLDISRIEIDGPKIVVVWVQDATDNSEANRGKGSHTTFSNFVGDRMAQLSETTDSGTQTPVRQFRRCR
jgi:hypothetical protein